LISLSVLAALLLPAVAALGRFQFPLLLGFADGHE
jgi:hypothetical protein